MRSPISDRFASTSRVIWSWVAGAVHAVPDREELGDLLERQPDGLAWVTNTSRAGASSS